MRRTVALFLFGTIMLSAMWFVGCASEPAQTKALYTDAKKMFDEVERAFTLQRGDERSKLMNQILGEKWDVQIVDKLRQYVKEAPNGSFSKEANELLDKAIKSDHLRMLGQARPLLEQYGQGIPKTAAEADSAAKNLMRQKQQGDSATKTGGQ